MGIRDRLISQAARPSGALGWLMAWGYRVLSIVWRPQYEKIAGLLDLQPEDDFLDIACGSGLFLQKYASPARHVAGVDHSEIQVSMARKINHRRLEAGTAEIIQADARALPWEDGRFSAVGCDSLQGINQPMVALGEMLRILRSGGRAVLAFSYFATENEAREAEQKRGLPMWTGAEVEAMIKAAGFTAVETTHDERVQYVRAIKLG